MKYAVLAPVHTPVQSISPIIYLYIQIVVSGAIVVQGATRIRNL